MTRRKAKAKARRPSAVLFLGDLHTGSNQAVAPARMVRNALQAQLLEHWRDMSKRAAQLAREYDLHLALGGDMIEGFHHGTTDVWAADEDEMMAGSLALLTPLAARAKRIYGVLGTEAHAGRMGQHDRMIYRELGAHIIPPGEDLEVDGAWLDWQHHGGTVGRLPWTVEQPLNTLARKTWYICLEEGVPPPALIMRHHVHTITETSFRGLRAAVCGCWQGVTMHGARMGHKFSGIGCWVWYPRVNGLELWRWRVDGSRSNAKA